MDKNKIFIGNVNYNTTIETLVEMASKFGTVKESYKPQGKGFAFITFETAEEAEAAIAGMNEQMVDDRKLNVNVARPREERPRNDFYKKDYQGGNDFRN